MALYVNNEEVQSQAQPSQEVANGTPGVVSSVDLGVQEQPTQEQATDDKKDKTRSYLSEISYVLTNANIQDDGKTFINIGSKVNTELGKQLSWNYPIKGLYTIFGLAGTIRNFSDAISADGFPVEYMGRHKIPRDILEQYVFSSTVKKNKIPNYWALIAYVTAEGIRCRPELQKLMKQNTLDYACVTESRKETVFGTEIVIPATIKQMLSYVGIVRQLDKMVKDGSIFDNKAVGKFIEDCKLAPEKDLLDGITLKTITA